MQPYFNSIRREGIGAVRDLEMHPLDTVNPFGLVNKNYFVKLGVFGLPITEDD